MPSCPRLVALVALLAGCGPEVRAIVDPARPEHFFDVPFPSDDLLGPEGTPDLSGYPVAEPELTASIEQGWIDRLQLTGRGFANHGAAYFRFDGPLADLPTTTAGTPEDVVLLVALDGEPELLPLEVRFVADPLGDPHWAPNTLALAPALGHPPKSGARYAAVVMRDAGVGPADGWEVPDDVAEALDAAGVRGKVAVSTSFTVQDAVGELGALADAVDATAIDWGTAVWRRVVAIEYAQGTTPSGDEATVFTARFEDGTERVAYLGAAEDKVQVVDLLDWPMVVWEVDLPTLNFQDADDRPYMSPGITTINDIDRFTGWIDFDDAGGVASEPWVEMMRVTVSIPKGPDGEPITGAKIAVWDHGTGGHAYNIVQRASNLDDSRALAQVFADEGWATIGRDATLYGTRYPLIDEGYGSSLGFYNVVNLPAFRDNQRQTAVDGHVLRRWIDERLAAELPAGGVDTSRVRRGGHSLGSVTSNLGVAARPAAWESVFLSGTGGVFSHYFLDTGLLQDIDPELVASLFPLFGAEAPEEVTIPAVAGALLGLDEEAWGRVDRLHPMLTLFQWSMDPSDPMSTARGETLPAFVSIAPGDWQTPDFTAEALSEALPDATVAYCEARGDYDPHHCLWREPEGPEILRSWLQGP